ncbi:hypothetical protein ACOMHN_025513 [Nucella lapillus]
MAAVEARLTQLAGADWQVAQSVQWRNVDPENNPVCLSIHAATAAHPCLCRCRPLGQRGRLRELGRYLVLLWCYGQEGRGLSDSDRRMQTLSPWDKGLEMELGPVNPSSPSTLELCAPPSSPPHLLPQEPLEVFSRCDNSSNGGDVEERGMPDTPISPQSCSPLPFPKIPPSPIAPSLLPEEGGGGDGDEVLSLSSSSPSPLSSIPSPTGSVASLFGPPPHDDRSALRQARALYGSNSSISTTHTQGSSTSNNDGWTIPSTVKKSSSSASSSSSSASSSSSSSASSVSSSSRANSSPPAEEADLVCQWEACGNVVNPGELLEHLREEHVDPQKEGGEKFVCQWAGCKVAGKASCSMSWLERHIIIHGGLKPFRCILPHCGARFPSQQALQRHVNAHFPAESPSTAGGRPARSRAAEDTSGRHIRRRNKLKRGRPQCVKHSDMFDTGIMDRLRQQLVDLTEKTHVYVNGSAQHLTFHGLVKGHRCDEKGKESMLLQWSPQDILEEAWVSPCEVRCVRQRVLPLSHLPASTVATIHPSFYSPHRFRKHRRK